MARKYLVDGRIFLEKSTRKILVDGVILFTTSGGAPPAVTAKPFGHHLLDRQYAAIAAHRLGGLLQ